MQCRGPYLHFQCCSANVADSGPFRHITAVRMLKFSESLFKVDEINDFVPISQGMSMVDLYPCPQSIDDFWLMGHVYFVAVV